MPVSSKVSAEVATISVSGRFDFSVHGEFKTASESLFANKNFKAVEVNLSQVDYIDSSALGILLVLKDRANSAGIQTLSLTGAKGLVKQILDVAHFGKFFTMR
jgi:anti-anti-sigma factor